MFKTRVISAVVLVVLMVAGIFAGSHVFTGLFMVISLIGMFEVYRVFKLEKSPMAIVGYMAALGFDIAIYLAYSELSMVVLVGALIAMMMVYIITFPKFKAEQVMITYFGFVYVAVMLSYVFRIRAMEDGFMLVWLVFICSWINDTCAYLVGVTCGKHKMTPKLSPKKSYEGAIGGIVGAAIVAAIYGYIFMDKLGTIMNPPVVCAVACAMGAFISIFGDLAASAIKRNHDVKDYGSLIPGHGGILDRFDSMIFIAPVVYWAIVLFTKI